VAEGKRGWRRTGTALGRRLTPIDADVTNGRLGRSGKSEGAANEAVTVRAGRKAVARLAVSPNRGIAARKAELPLHVPCTDAAPTEVPRIGTMLMLTSKQGRGRGRRRGVPHTRFQVGTAARSTAQWNRASGCPAVGHSTTVSWQGAK